MHLMDASSTIDPLSLEIDCHSVKRKMDHAEAFLLLDCRQPDEHAIVHIRGAVLLPLDQLPARLDELNAYRDQAIVVFCHLGGRSLQAAAWLRNQGFPTAQSMAGGVDRWAVEIDNSLPRY